MATEDLPFSARLGEINSLTFQAKYHEEVLERTRSCSLHATVDCPVVSQSMLEGQSGCGAVRGTGGDAVVRTTWP